MTSQPYRKKPVVIEAIPVAEVMRCMEKDWQALPQWVADAYEKGELIPGPVPKLSVKTMEGWLEAPPTWWLIQGVKGELYPCAPDVFEMTYDAVPTPDTEPDPSAPDPVGTDA